MRRKKSLLTIAGLNALAAALNTLPVQAAVSPEQESPIHRLHEIRRAYVDALGQGKQEDRTKVAQYWGNFPNFPNFPNWAKWNNWLNGWRNF